MHNYVGEQMHIICIHTCICTYIYTYIGTYIHTYIYAYMYTYLHICIYTCVHIYMHAWIHTYIHRGVGREFPVVCGNSIQFLYTLLKPEAYLGILTHKYWNRNHCMNATLPLVVNKRYKGVLKVWLRNTLSTRRGIILSNISVRHFNRAIITNLY